MGSGPSPNGSGVVVRRTRLTLLLAGAAVLGPSMAPLVLPIVARAANPCPTSVTYPNDPGYNPAEGSSPGSTTWNDEQWYLYGCMPKTAPVSTDPENASGMNIDQTWATYTKGRDEIIVAYMEGGVNWRIETSCELKDRAYLNKGELPLPEDAAGHTKPQLIAMGHHFNHPDPYDLNDDGVFNVEDYLLDPRVAQALVGVPKSPAGGPFLHHVCGTGSVPGGTDITPEDLIVAFGHCRVNAKSHLVAGAFPCDPTKRYDNDHNGYPNDINGWNFNRDNNDPQTEQSIYAHFDGESAQVIGETNNGFRNAGMCPQCRYIPIKAGDEAIDRPDRVAEAVAYAADAGVKVLDATSATLGLTPEVKAAIDYGYHKGMVITWASNDFESADHTDGMFYPHVWPGNSIVGDRSTRGANLPPPTYYTNTTFRSRSSLTSYGPHALFSVPNNDGSTSTGTPTQAGVAALVASEGLNAVDAHTLSAQLNADEIKQVVRSTASYIGPIASCPICFQGISGATFNIQYGYGRPNVLAATQAVALGHIPPTADIRSPDWYQEVDPTKQSTLHVTADVAAARAAGGAYTYKFQFAPGPEPTEAAFQTFASGSGSSPQNVAADLDLSLIPASFWSGQYAVDPATRSSIEQYDVSIRVQVVANDGTGTSQMGEDRRAFHLRHDASEVPGFPLRLSTSGESSPTMADIEGRGWLDTIIGTADGTVHVIRPNGTEAPGFPVHTGLVPGMDPAYDTNYLKAAAWRSGLPRPRDGTLSALAVGDLRHDGGLEVVMSTFSGRTYAWDGTGKLLAGFPVLNGSPALYHLSVPPPDTPYSFEPENVTGASPVLAPLSGNGHLDIIQAAGDNHVYAWEVTSSGVQAVPGWPISAILPASSIPANSIHTHDAKIVPTPAIADIAGDGKPDVLVGLVDTTFPNNNPLGQVPVTGYLEAFHFDGNNHVGGAMITGWPVALAGLEQGYGVAQDFVTQGVESPAVYDSPQGPQAIANPNLFLPYRIDLHGHSVSAAFAGSSITPPVPAKSPPGGGALVQFTTSASLGNVLGLATPQVFQAGSPAAGIVLGITQTPGAGFRVDNGIGAWDPTTGQTLSQYNQYLQGLGFFTAPAVADVTGDGHPDVIQAADSGAIQALDGLTGAVASGFPKWSGGFSLFTPAVGDLLRTGTVSVAAMTREGYLHVWQTAGLTSANNEAWHWHQNDWNDGHYRHDTRPPAAIHDVEVSRSGPNDLLSFDAVGDDWNSGTAKSYEVRRSSLPITQATFAQATPVAVSQTPQPAGSHEVLTVPHGSGQTHYAVRAIDAAGNIGPVQVRVGTAGYNPFPSAPSGSALTGLLTPFAGQGRGLVGAVLAILMLIAAVRIAGPGPARVRIPAD